MTQAILEKSRAASVPIVALAAAHYKTWLKKQSTQTIAWLEAQAFENKAGKYLAIPSKQGNIECVVAIIDDTPHIWSIAHLATALPAGVYHLESELTREAATNMTLGWALACYQFTRYKKNTHNHAQLVAPKSCDLAYVRSTSEAMCWARDMINSPANDMNPDALAEEAVKFAQSTGGKVHVIRGANLLKENYPMIYAVGKAAAIPPYFVDIRFAKKGAPKVTLVGKGVCFDSGGLDIKSSAGMKLMKKDMGGAAAVLALAKMIVEAKLPVQLRVLLPIVENAVSGNAMRPLDVVPTRKGITVEIGNTDAEGRLILCDALTEADDESPDLLIDCATLTGAARVALGTDIPAFFTNDDALAEQVAKHAKQQNDPLWRLPLWDGYRSQLDSKVADLSNDPDSSYGGAITAALYLKEFVSKTTSWLHIDMMAWNASTKPGRPQGGEAMAVRALFALIAQRYAK